MADTRGTILVVDNNRVNLEMLGGRLGALGYRMMLSDTGREAIDLICGGGIDLVLLGMMMPDRSGIAVLAEVRGRRDTADLPIIMVTGRSDPHAAAAALAAGADDWIAKPFAFELIAARIERTLARAARLADRKRSNAALDARRAIDPAEVSADHVRLLASIQALDDEVARLMAVSA